jgi:non-ribosomal peptide synthetase component F
MVSVHRFIEIHAAERGSAVALISSGSTLTYGELNRRANALSRCLRDHGLRRGSRAVVRMRRSPELAIALLAVLKAGAAYTWHDLRDGDRWPEGISLVRDGVSADEVTFTIDTGTAIEASLGTAPNLPVLTRGEDIACVLPHRTRVPGLLVPHATIVALRVHPFPTPAPWSSDLSALDLWIPLMAGAPVILRPAADAAAA